MIMIKHHVCGDFYHGKVDRRIGLVGELCVMSTRQHSVSKSLLFTTVL